MNYLCVILLIALLVVWLIFRINRNQVDNMVTTPKIAILVIYNDSNARWREEAEIWLQYANTNSNIDVFFIHCNKNNKTKYNHLKNYMALDCEESFQPGIFQKTILALDKLSNYDYYIRTNLSTFLIFDYVLDFVRHIPTDVPVHTGPVDRKENLVWVQGATMFINNLAKDILVNTGKQLKNFNDSEIQDDVLITEILIEKGVKPINSSTCQYVWDFNKDFQNNIKIVDKQESPCIRLKSDDPSIRKLLYKRYYG